MNSEWLLYDNTLDRHSQKEVTNLMRMFLYIIPGISIALATVDFVFGYPDIAFATLSVPVFCGLAMAALNRDRINLAMIIVVSMMIIFTTIICILGSRIHEVGIIIFPVIVIFSSLVMNIKGLILTASSVIICLGIIVFGDKFDWFPTTGLHDYYGWIDLSVALTVIIIHTFITYSFSGITRNNLQRIRDELQAQKEYKDQIAENLTEKTELLRLVHHRVKNNLLLINSLIELETYGKPNVKEELMEVTDSIHTIARAHDPLYHTDDYKQVAIKPYLEKLIASFIQSNATKDIRAQLEDCLIFHEQALLLGIILQKILSSIDNLEQMEIDVSLITRNGSHQLIVVNNNGYGFSLGDTSLLQLLLSEINGKVDFEPKKVLVTFKASDKNKAVLA